MSRNHRIFPPLSSWLSILLCFLPTSPTRAQESRVFTNKDGKAIEAELIAVNGTQAEIRRAADGQVFQLEIVNLCLDDQAWIADWLRGKSGDWQNLRLAMPDPTGYVSIIGLSSSNTVERVGGSEHELLLPVGAWVELNVYLPGSSTDILKHLVRYDGASRWEVTVEGRAMRLSRDGGPARIIGLTPPRPVATDPAGIAEEHAAFLRGFDPTGFAEGLSIELPGRFESAGFRELTTPLVAVTSDAVIDGEQLKKLSHWKIGAFSLVLGKGTLEALKDFPTVEALRIRTGIFEERNGVRVPKYPDDDFNLPQVRDLSLMSITFSDSLERSLAKMTGLRLLEQYPAPLSSSDPSNRPPNPEAGQTWSGLDGFPSLQSIYISTSVGLNPREVASMPSLKALNIGGATFSTNDPELMQLTRLQGMLILSINTSSFKEEILDEWGSNGGLQDLRLLRGFKKRGFEMMPDLERLTIYSPPNADLAISRDAFTPLENLAILSLSNPTSEELEALRSLPHPDRLEAFRLLGGKMPTLDALAALPCLKRLELQNWEASPETLDLGGFAPLEYLMIARATNLREIAGVSAHPALQALRIFDCEALAGFGTPSENTTLRVLYFANCASITSLSGFAKTTGLAAVGLYNCDSLAEPLAIDQASPRALLTVSGCELLQDRRPSLPTP